ncbi:MAG: hypothetical protein R3E00_16315 [Paracoccaceae bacterium]
MLRRTTTILLCAGSFWLGVKTGTAFNLGAIPAAGPACEGLQ